MKNPLKNKINPVFFDITLISIITSLLFLFTINSVNKVDLYSFGGEHSWLTASTMKFTNNWLSDGIMEDKFTMLEMPLSIESNTIESRAPYISYPNGTILITYGIAKAANRESVGYTFLKALCVILYGLDSLLIAILFYMILNYVLKLTSRSTKIYLSVLLSLVWILLPSNVYYLKNVLFADQLVLFFICLLLVLEVLRNYCGITNHTGKIIIEVMIFFTVFMGMSIEYYFWIQVFILCVINFISAWIENKSFIYSLKRVSIYIIPSLLAIVLFLLQITQIDNWSERLNNKMVIRMGHHDNISHFKYVSNYLYSAFGYIGTVILFINTLGSIITLCCIMLLNGKNIEDKKSVTDFLKISLLIIVPAYIQIVMLKNHSAYHEFSILKLNLLLVFGFLLVAYVIFMVSKQSLGNRLEIFFKMKDFWKKISINTYALLVTLLVLLFMCFNIYPDRIYFFSNNVNKYYSNRYYPQSFPMESILREMNDYENVFFSYTESIRPNPPHSLAIAHKMVHKIKQFDDINNMFPDLPSEANKILIINHNRTDKEYKTLNEEQYVMENYMLMKEQYGYAIFLIKSFDY